jgi:hypothetical protein
MKTTMNKENLIETLLLQEYLTEKTTRKYFVSVVCNLVEKHIKNGAEIEGISPTPTGVNLGDTAEIIIKSLFRNKLVKSQKDYDAQYKGEKIEVKWTTTDAYAHPINENAKVDYYIIATYSKKLGGQVFKIPYGERQNIQVDTRKRPIPNQKAKYLNLELTAKVFGA